MLSAFNRFNIFCANYTSPIILSAIAVGFLTDLFAGISNTILSIILFLELFLACFTVKMDEIREIVFSKIVILFVSRYLILPVLLYFIGLQISPDFGLALLLLTLLPAGVSSPGFASLFKANVALTIAIVLFSSLLAPFYIPLMIKKIAHLSIEISALNMLVLIASIVVAPILFSLPFRRSKRFSTFMVENNSGLLLPLVWFTIVVPISRIRGKFFADVTFYLEATFGFIFLYIIFIFFGILIAKILKNVCVKSNIISSSIHNITLGVVIALIYFSESVSTLVITANISLLLMVTFLKPLFGRIK